MGKKNVLVIALIMILVALGVHFKSNIFEKSRSDGSDTLRPQPTHKNAKLLSTTTLLPLQPQKVAVGDKPIEVRWSGANHLWFNPERGVRIHVFTGKNRGRLTRVTGRRGLGKGEKLSFTNRYPRLFLQAIGGAGSVNMILCPHGSTLKPNGCLFKGKLYPIS